RTHEEPPQSQLTFVTASIFAAVSRFVMRLSHWSRARYRRAGLVGPRPPRFRLLARRRRGGRVSLPAPPIGIAERRGVRNDEAAMVAGRIRGRRGDALREHRRGAGPRRRAHGPWWRWGWPSDGRPQCRGGSIRWAWNGPGGRPRGRRRRGP